MPKTVRALAMASHPGPAAVVTVVAAVLAGAVSYPVPRVLLVSAAILADQLSVGWSNDWIDAARDRAVARADKPIVTGAVPRTVVGAAAVLALVVALLLTVPMGPAALCAHAVALAGAWGYNAGLKRTLFSVVPYMVSFGALPAIITLGAPDPRWPVWWVIAAGCLLGAAAHLTNVLPDLEQDALTGVRGFGHALGARRGGLVSFGLLAVVGVTIAVGSVAASGLRGWPAGLVLGGTVATLGIAAAGTVLVLRGVHSRWPMRLVMACAVVDVIALAAAGPVLSV